MENFVYLPDSNALVNLSLVSMVRFSGSRISDVHSPLWLWKYVLELRGADVPDEDSPG